MAEPRRTGRITNALRSLYSCGDKMTRVLAAAGPRHGSRSSSDIPDTPGWNAGSSGPRLPVGYQRFSIMISDLGPDGAPP